MLGEEYEWLVTHFVLREKQEKRQENGKTYSKFNWKRCFYVSMPQTEIVLSSYM